MHGICEALGNPCGVCCSDGRSLLSVAACCNTPTAPTPPPPPPPPAPIRRRWRAWRAFARHRQCRGTRGHFRHPSGERADRARSPSTCTPASGHMFPIGTTTVTCTATDSLNRQATCSFNVTVSKLPPLSKTRFWRTATASPPVKSASRRYAAAGRHHHAAGIVPSAAYPTVCSTLAAAAMRPRRVRS